MIGYYGHIIYYHNCFLKNRASESFVLTICMHDIYELFMGSMMDISELSKFTHNELWYVTLSWWS